MGRRLLPTRPKDRLAGSGAEVEGVGALKSKVRGPNITVPADHWSR